MYIQKRGPDGGPPGLDTHAQIAIGVIIPVVVLLGGLLLFIWYTEKQRRNRRGETLPGSSSHAPSRPKINSYLHRSSKALPGIRTSQIDVDAIEIVRPRASDAKMHELEDTGKVELQEMQKTLNRLNNRLNRDDDRERTTSPRNVNERNDSAIEAAAARLESRDTDRSREGPERKELDTTKMEHVVQTPHESKRYSNREYRSSLQPEYRSSLKPGMCKRDTRVASSRYSKEVRYSKDVEARFSKDAAARYSANVEQLRDLHHNSMHANGGTTTPGGGGARMSMHSGFNHTSLHARDRDRDSNILSPSKESLDQQSQPQQAHFTFTTHRLSTATSNPNMALPPLSSDPSPDSPTVSDISRPTNRNSALSGVPPDRSSQRWSGIPGEMPSWMKRLSMQDTVEGKWRSEGEIVPPENVRVNGGGGEGGVGVGVGVQGTLNPSSFYYVSV